MAQKSCSLYMITRHVVLHHHHRFHPSPFFLFPFLLPHSQKSYPQYRHILFTRHCCCGFLCVCLYSTSFPLHAYRHVKKTIMRVYAVSLFFATSPSPLQLLPLSLLPIFSSVPPSPSCSPAPFTLPRGTPLVRVLDFSSTHLCMIFTVFSTCFVSVTGKIPTN